MNLDEQLRQLADAVPAPPPGDAAGTFRRGAGRRRVRQGMGVASLIGLVAVLGVGISALTDDPRLEITDGPPPSASPGTGNDDESVTNSDDLVVTQPPTLALSGNDPFPWAVAVSAVDDGRWCATTVRGSSELPDPVGQPCGQLVTEPEPDDFSWHGTESDSLGTAPEQGLSWGLAGRAIDDAVTVKFADGTSGSALLDSGNPGGVTLWAIAYEDTAIQEIEASGDRATTGTVVLEGFDPFDALVLVGFLAVAMAVIVAVRRTNRRRKS